MDRIPDEKASVAARVRAVLAYAALSYDDAGERAGIGPSTIRRIASPTNPRGATIAELGRIADACGLPLRWLINPWDDEPELPTPALGVGSTADRLRTIEHYVAALLIIEEARGAEVPLPPALEAVHDELGRARNEIVHGRRGAPLPARISDPATDAERRRRAPAADESPDTHDRA